MTDAKSSRDGVYLYLVLWKAFKAMEGFAMRNIEANGMCGSDFGVLEALLHKGPLTVSALGAKVLLTSGSITTAVDRLEARGLVERANDTHDRRTRIVHLTAEGRKLIRKLFAQHETEMRHAVSALDGGERATLIELLKKLGKSLEGENK